MRCGDMLPFDPEQPLVKDRFPASNAYYDLSRRAAVITLPTHIKR